jgi:bacterioferritin-associated ferredoxin
MRCESGLSISARKNRSRTLGENSFRIVQNGVRSQQQVKKKLPAGSFCGADATEAHQEAAQEAAQVVSGL